MGEQAVALTFLPGEDETAAARSALNGWSSVLGRLPKEGRYTAGLTMVQAEGGYYAAVRLTVTQAGRDDDDDDGPDYTYDKATNTYTVYTAKGLKAWAEDAAKNLDLNCTLASDITLSGEWTPIGSDEDHAYKGDFDGGGHTITGLKVNIQSDFAGLFGCIDSGGKVQDLTLAGVEISGTGDYVGGVVGWNNGAITGCSSSAAVTGIYNVGGVAGYNDFSGTITACYHANGDVTGSVSGTGSYVGGVVGSNNSTSTIAACYWDNNQSNGIGSGGGDVTQVTGTTTWGTAPNAMNTALAGCGWSYENGSGDQPLILKKIGG